MRLVRSILDRGGQPMLVYSPELVLSRFDQEQPPTLKAATFPTTPYLAQTPASNHCHVHLNISITIIIIYNSHPRY
jgi:hypothetical protein